MAFDRIFNAERGRKYDRIGFDATTKVLEKQGYVVKDNTDTPSVDLFREMHGMRHLPQAQEVDLYIYKDDKLVAVADPLVKKTNNWPLTMNKPRFDQIEFMDRKTKYAIRAEKAGIDFYYALVREDGRFVILAEARFVRDNATRIRPMYGEWTDGTPSNVFEVHRDKLTSYEV